MAAIAFTRDEEGDLFWLMGYIGELLEEGEEVPWGEKSSGVSVIAWKGRFRRFGKRTWWQGPLLRQRKWVRSVGRG